MKMSVRNVCSWAIASLLILFGVVRRAKLKALRGDFILSLYFHKPSKKEFEACIKWMKKNKFVFLSPNDLLEIIQHNLPMPKGGVLITVDDGWQTNKANIVEVANKYCIPVTIFVSTEPVEEGVFWWSYLKVAKSVLPNIPSKATLKTLRNEIRLSFVNSIRNKKTLEREALTVEQITDIARSEYVIIGGHTHTHPILINCDDARVYDELKISKQKLEVWTKGEVYCFAYPNGDYGNREINLLRDLNYTLAFSSKPQYLTKEKLSNHYELPRFGYLENASFAENICRIVGVWQPLILKFQRIGKKNNNTESINSNPIGDGLSKKLLQFH